MPTYVVSRRFAGVVDGVQCTNATYLEQQSKIKRGPLGLDCGKLGCTVYRAQVSSRARLGEGGAYSKSEANRPPLACMHLNN